MTDQDDLRELLTNTAATGDTPSAKELMSVSLTGSIGERKKSRGALTSAFQDIARRSTRGEDLAERIDDIVNRYAPTEAHDPAALAAGVDRSPGWRAVKTGQAEPSAVRTLADALNHSSITKRPMSTNDLANLEPSADLDPAAASKWRADVWEASQEVAAIAATGRHIDSWATARELAGGLADGLAEPGPAFDPSESARRPDGSYDPAELATRVYRANGTVGRY